MFKKVQLIWFFTFLLQVAFAQEIDSVLLVKKSQFFQDYQNREGYVSPLNHIKTGLFKTNYKRLNTHWRRIFKMGNSLYVHFTSTGKLYQLVGNKDSNLVFNRIDLSENYNYNCVSNIFVDRNNILDFAGYGFWKSNGTLRRFNTIDKEWDAYPLNREVIPPLNQYAAWYDPYSHAIIVPYQEILNEGLVSNDKSGVLNFTTNRLNIDAHSWETIGELTDFAKKILTRKLDDIITDRGFIFIFYDRLYWFDFIDNSISELSNDEKAQTLIRIPENAFYYYYQQKVYVLNTVSYKYDSIELDVKKFVKTPNKIWNKRFDYTPYVAGGSIFIVLVLGSIIFWRIRKRKIASLVSLAEVVNPFTETEIGLLELLLEKFKKDKTATITDINYVLGVKDKNQGMQKKVRSDVIGSINEKYSLFTKQKHALIQSIRSETDKRYFEYFLSKDAIPGLGKLLQKD